MYSDFTANGLYGGNASQQPTASPVATHAPGTPEPMAKTIPTPSGAGFNNPTFLLVVMVALAFGLVHFSVRVGK